MLILSKKKLHAGLSIIQSNENNKKMKSTIMQEKNRRIVCTPRPFVGALRFAVVLA